MLLLHVPHRRRSVVQVADVRHFETHIDHEWQLSLRIHAENETLVHLLENIFFQYLVPLTNLVCLIIHILLLELADVSFFPSEFCSAL